MMLAKYAIKTVADALTVALGAVLLVLQAVIANIDSMRTR